MPRIVIVKFRAFDKPHEKNFYQGESVSQIHQALFDICNTYVPGQVIVCPGAVASSEALGELLRLQPTPSV